VITLESIASCFHGQIPSPLATCSADGVPNVTYMSIVHYIDSERVGLSRQFLNKTRGNLDANPYCQASVVDPETFEEYVLELQYLHTETEGPVFEAMRANLEAVASQTGMGDVFRLRGVDVHRVLRCAAVSDRSEPPAARAQEGDPLRLLDDFVRRVALCRGYDEATTTALQAIDDLFGFRHAILLIADERGAGLFAVADNGYPGPAVGAEVALGDGVIGVAAQRRQVVAISNLARSRAMRTAVRESLGDLPAREIALPGLEAAQSVAAVPLVVHGSLMGVLFLESERAHDFGPHNERILRILGGHLATTLAALERDRHETAPDRVEPASPAPARGDAVAVSYYQADDSVFVGGEYLVKGVPGRILWKLLREHAADERALFTNRELRLDERLGLPPGNDNLEARLLVLRRRLDGRDGPIRLERTGRGQLTLHVGQPLELIEVPTSGPMRAAHGPPEAGG
jgi:adenylate cyclase